jgi:hypothetical protein
MNKFLSFITALIVISCISSCTKQNEPTALKVTTALQRSNDYFANLRAYKKSPHQIYFGWFGGTGGPGSADFPGVLDGSGTIRIGVDFIKPFGTGCSQHYCCQQNHQCFKRISYFEFMHHSIF